MPNPVRIYVLHHPASKLAEGLTNRIYDWFRLPSMEGIPVYVRSAAARDHNPQKPWPSLPQGMKEQERVIEYLIPLVDAHMVRDPVWHDYLSELAKRCEASAAAKGDTYQGVLFPVALDATAFNLPPIVARRNFIRHPTEPVSPANDKEAQETFATGETLKHLTEALARDLNRRVFPERAKESARFKIFISYARADGTEIAKALRNYIQSQTQCLAFLDENDIAYGQPFDESLKQNAGGLARAMIVVNSDQYADRSWCRWEIARFTKPRFLPDEVPDADPKPAPIHVFDPLLVVDAVNGTRMTRVLPELGLSPMVRWSEGRARDCFSVLMREVLLGLRDVRVAQEVFEQEADSGGAIFVNRLPGPVAIERLLQAKTGSEVKPLAPKPQTIRYPGNGLSLIELRLLRKTFEHVRFRAFQDVMKESPEADGTQSERLARMRKLLEDIESGRTSELPLRGKLFVISTSYNDPDLAALGLLQQNQDEALFHLLRPLLRLGADLSYGGLPPTSSGELRPSATRNITAALLRLVSEERPEDNEDEGKKETQKPRGSLLFNVCAWPRYENIGAEEEAGWINSYRIKRFRPEDAGLAPWPHAIPLANEVPAHGYLRYVARTTSAIRAQLGQGFKFRLPMEGERLIPPAAFVFMGGKLADFSGIMPGIMEEFLHVAGTNVPIYLFGGLGGAAGVIARALCADKSTPCPDDLTVAWYAKKPCKRKHDDYNALLAQLEPKDPKPEEYFDELWSLIQKHRAGGLDQLFKNGLSHEENRTLLTTDNTLEAVRLAWKGMSQRLLLQAQTS